MNSEGRLDKMAVGLGVMGSQHINTLDVLPFWGRVWKLGDKTTQSTAIVCFGLPSSESIDHSPLLAFHFTPS